MTGRIQWRLGEPGRSDWIWLRDLLTAADLPPEGVGPAGGRFVVATDERGLVRGGVGLEGGPPDALLRSLIVDPESRGTGLGELLLAAAQEMAAQAGVRRLYLLTTTAADYFESRGYDRIRREDAPPSIRATDEFSRLCPDSAVAMVRSLGDDPAGLNC